VSNKSVITYEAPNPCEITPGDLTYNGTTYDVAASTSAAAALAAASAAQAAAAAAQATANAAQATANAALPLAGGTMSGTIHMDNVHTVQDLPLPVLGTDAASKAYVDSVAGISPGFFGSYYDTTNQVAALANTGYPVTLNTVVGQNGVSIVSGSRMTFATKGTYNIQFSLQFVNADTQVHEATVWIRLNGFNIPYSAGAVAVPNSHGGTHGQTIAAWNYIFTLNAGDYVQLYWQTNNTGISIEYVVDGAAPISPSAILTAQQVMNTQSGPTGPAGTSILYGTVDPTAAVGNNGDFYINTTSGYLFGPKASGTWPVGTPITSTSSLLKANNLSDLTSVTSARTNLGLGTAATQNITAFATAAQGTLASTAVQRVGDAMTGNLTMTQSVNGGAGFATTNTNAGTSAQANLACTSDGGTFYFGAASTASSFAGGGFLYTNANVPLTLWTWNTKRMTIPGNGDATLHTGLAVQGALSTTDNITLTKSAAGATTVGVTNTNATGQPQFSATSNGGTFYFGAGYTGGSFNGGGFIYTASNVPCSIWTNNTKRLEITGTGNVGVGGVAPTARLHLPAGTTSANTAPLKIASGTNMATAEDGAMEYNGSALYFTMGTTRYNLTAPSMWSFDSAYNSGGTGTSQYITLIQLAVNDVYEIEVNVRVAETSNNLTAEMAQVKARCTVRRPGTATFATQFLNAITDKQTTTNVAGFGAFIEEDATTKGLIRLRIAGVAGYTLVGRAFGWIK